MNQNQSVFRQIVKSCLLLALLLPVTASAQVLDFVEAQFDGPGVNGSLDNPRFATVSPDGRHVYVASENSDTVALFDRDPRTGALTFVEAQFDGVGGVDGLDGAAAVAVSPDGRHVYVGAAMEAAVAVFERNSDGTLDFLEVLKDGVGGVTGLASTVWISVSPDGKNVYTTGFAGAAVVFTRNQDGTLTHLQTRGGLGGAFSHTVSPNGQHFYVASLAGAVVVFDRQGDGSLSLTQIVFNNSGGVSGLGGARTVAVAGRHLYVASLFDSAVAVFERHPVTGKLTFVEAQFNGSGGVTGISFASSAFLDNGGRRLYATGFFSAAVAVFDRNPATGALTFIEAAEQGVGGVDGLNGVIFADTSPNGKNVYATGSSGDSVAVFSVSQGGQ